MEEINAPNCDDCAKADIINDAKEYYDPKEAVLKIPFVSYLSKIITKERRQKVLEYLCISALIVAIVILGYYILFPAKGSYHSDTTDTILWAQAALESGSWYNEDFRYACIVPFGGYLFMLPFVAIFGYSLKAQALGMLFFFAVFVTALLFMLKKLGCSFNACCIITAANLFLISGSTKMREIFWEHILYYSLNILFALIGLSLIFCIIDKIDSGVKSKKGYIVFAVLLFVWCFVTSINKAETLLLFIFPLFGAFAAERLLNSKRAKTAYEFYGNAMIPIIIAVAALLGLVVSGVLTSSIEAEYQASRSIFSPITDWYTNLTSFYQSWFTLFGVDILGMQNMLTISSIIDMSVLFSAVIILIVPLIMLFNYKRIEDRKVRILLLFHFFLSLLLMIMYTIGVIGDVNWRVSPMMFTSVLLTLICFAHLPKAVKFKRISNIFVLPLAFVAVMFGGNLLYPPDYKSGYFDVAEELENFEANHGVKLDYGYGTYWESLIITLINSEEIPVRYIHLVDDNYRIREYQVNMNWYKDQPEAENYFVLLSSDEYVYYQETENSLFYHESYVETFEICDGKYYVLLYSDNIFG